MKQIIISLCIIALEFIACIKSESVKKWVDNKQTSDTLELGNLESPALLSVVAKSSHNASMSDGDLLKEISKNGPYSSEGCFSEFSKEYTASYGAHEHSNIRCQRACREMGYTLSATQGRSCFCGNLFPQGKDVDDNICNTKCLSHATTCHGPDECCGGQKSGAYSISMVGNIDIGKQLLRRLRNEWLSNAGWRNTISVNTNFTPKDHKYNWWSSFDKAGWSKVNVGYMTGMYRSANGGSNDGIFRLEEAKSRDAPAYLKSTENDKICYKESWWSSFDRKGWSTCKKGYYMTGLYRTGSGHNLYNIEEAECCRPVSQDEEWGHCYNHNVWGSFDNAGWSSCNADYYMVGLYRNSCESLYCLEEFKCCKMGANNGKSWVDNPKLSIKMRNIDTEENNQCSMDVADSTPISDTYECKSIGANEKRLHLKGTKFTIEDSTPLNVAKPTPIPHFKPHICSASNVGYTCSKSYSTTLSTTSAFKTGSGYSIETSIGAEVSVEASASLFGVGVKTTASLRSQLSTSASFSSERSTSNTKSVTDETDISVDVPPGTEVTVNIMRTKQDLEYVWKSEFAMSGEFYLEWKDGTKHKQDIASFLGDRRNFFAFGKWTYPDTDMLQVIVTDKYGEQVGEYCNHETGEGSSCKITANHNENGTYVKKYSRKWPHCNNIKCIHNSPLSTMEAECNKHSSCTGFSFTTGKTYGWGCLKKCGSNEFGGYGHHSHDYWEKKSQGGGKKRGHFLRTNRK